MADIKWIKITTDIFDDEKILMIESLPDADAIIVIWFKLLCLAGKQNNSGVFLLNDRIPYTEKMLASIFRRKESTVEFALKTFEEFGMIEVVDGVITIPNWGKHQNLDQLERKKEYMRNYMNEYRGKQKQLIADNATQSEACKTNCKTNSKANVSRADIDIDKDIRIIKKENILKERKFLPPTVEEVNAYITEKKLPVNAEKFVDYYSMNGWKVGKNKMKDWKAAVRYWARGDKKNELTDRTCSSDDWQRAGSGDNPWGLKYDVLG